MDGNIQEVSREIEGNSGDFKGWGKLIADNPSCYFTAEIPAQKVPCFFFFTKVALLEWMKGGNEETGNFSLRDDSDWEYQYRN